MVSDPHVNDIQPRMRILTPEDERIPVLLWQVQTLAQARQTVDQFLCATIANNGLLSTDISRAAVITRSNQQQGDRLLGVTDDETVWQTHFNVIINTYHPPCAQPENCQLCSNPAVVVVCFLESYWNQTPGPFIAMRDDFNAAHGLVLRGASAIEEQRYIRIVDRLVNANSASYAAQSNAISAGNQMSISQSSLANSTTTDPTKGLKGRSLVSDNRSDNKKKDYSKGTLHPTTAEQGVKAETDTCLTCIEYNRKCKGTTMTLVPTSRNGRKAMWKCDQRRNPQRRCLWRKDMLYVTTYDEAFTADGGKKLDKNTVQGRKERAERIAANIKNGNDLDDDEGDGDDEEDGEEE